MHVGASLQMYRHWQHVATWTQMEVSKYMECNINNNEYTNILSNINDLWLTGKVVVCDCLAAPYHYFREPCLSFFISFPLSSKSISLF